MKKIILLLIMLSIIPLYSADKSRRLSWQQCLTLTLQKNLDLKSAKEKITQARANKGIARSIFFPQISTNTSVTTTKNESETYNSYSYGLSVDQLIFDGLASVNSYLKTGSDIDAALYEYLVTESNTVYTVRTAFINLLKSQEYINISKEILKRRTANYKLVKMRYEAGREHRGSVLSSEADMENARIDFNQVKRDLDLNQKVLFAAIGISDPSYSIKADGDLDIIIDLSKKPDCADIAKSNPIIKKMISLKKSAGYKKNSSYSDYSPQIYAFMNAGGNGSEKLNHQKQLSAGIKITFPIFEGGKTYYNVKKAESEFRQAVTNERNTKLNVIITLEEKWSNLINKKEKVNVQFKYYKAAMERAKIAESQYSIGIISFDNWTIIEESLVNSTKKYLEAKTDLLYAESEWIQAKGETYNNGK